MNTHVMTLTLPRPFRNGPQFDEDGNLIDGSWPEDFMTDGILGWIAIGAEVSGRVMVDAVIDAEHIDEWVATIPGGWAKASHHSWDLVSGGEFDEDGNLIASPLETLTPTDQAEYIKYKPPEFDENGDPLPGPITYARIHKIFGWPDIAD